LDRFLNNPMYQKRYKKFDVVKFVSGYRSDRLSMCFKFKGVRVTASDEKTYLGTGHYFAISSLLLYKLQ